jgi:hypothetical protein
MIVKYCGELMDIAECAALIGISKEMLAARIARGATGAALFSPRPDKEEEEPPPAPVRVKRPVDPRYSSAELSAMLGEINTDQYLAKSSEESRRRKAAKQPLGGESREKSEVIVRLDATW